jgi:hypothetical protein
LKQAIRCVTDLSHEAQAWNRDKNDHMEFNHAFEDTSKQSIEVDFVVEVCHSAAIQRRQEFL